MSRDSRARFGELMGSTPWRLDLALLLISAEVAPGGDLDSFLARGLGEFDRLAAAVAPEGRNAEGRDDERLRGVLGDFGGRPEDYESLSSSIVTAVLRRRRGLPILLSAVWTEVARRAGIAAYGVALPGHFVVAVGDPTTFRADALDGSRVLIDPWRGGALLPYDRARDLVERAGYVFRRELLAPADPVQTVARTLANIRAWAEHPLRAPTRLWAVDLALRLPDPPVALLRERGLALADLGHYSLAARWLEEYAELTGESPERARRVRANLN